ncbi:MAG: hypothetical protein ACQEV6_00375 [Pseudomonadota bacterium]
MIEVTFTLYKNQKTMIPNRGFKTSITVLLTALFSGCATSPWLKDAWDTPQYEDANLTQDEQVRLGYLARYLSESDTRAKLESQILKTEYVHQWGVSDYSTTASMAGDAFKGQVASDLGAEFGAAVLVLGLMAGDGSMEYISQAFLPAEKDGVLIKSAKEAKLATNALIRERLERVAMTLDTSLECIQGCDNHADSIYVMQLSSETPDESFIYWPSDIVVTVDVGGAVAVDPDDPISSLTGFQVAWKTLPGNSAEVRLYSEGTYDASGELAFKPNRGGRKIDPMVRHNIEKTALGQSILKSVYADTQMIWGSQDLHPGMIFFDGDVYGFRTNGRTGFVDQRVDIEALTPR